MGVTYLSTAMACRQSGRSPQLFPEKCLYFRTDVSEASTGLVSKRYDAFRRTLPGSPPPPREACRLPDRSQRMPGSSTPTKARSVDDLSVAITGLAHDSSHVRFICKGVDCNLSRSPLNSREYTRSRVPEQSAMISTIRYVLSVLLVSFVLSTFPSTLRFEIHVYCIMCLSKCPIFGVI